MLLSTLRVILIIFVCQWWCAKTRSGSRTTGRKGSLIPKCMYSDRGHDLSVKSVSFSFLFCFCQRGHGETLSWQSHPFSDSLGAVQPQFIQITKDYLYFYIFSIFFCCCVKATATYCIVLVWVVAVCGCLRCLFSAQYNGKRNFNCGVFQKHWTITCDKINSSVTVQKGCPCSCRHTWL